MEYSKKCALSNVIHINRHVCMKLVEIDMCKVHINVVNVHIRYSSINICFQLSELKTRTKTINEYSCIHKLYILFFFNTREACKCLLSVVRLSNYLPVRYLTRCRLKTHLIVCLQAYNMWFSSLHVLFKWHNNISRTIKILTNTSFK